MGLDVSIEAVVTTDVFSDYVTHNLDRMAEAAGIYQYLWRPEELNITTAGELIVPLTEGLEKLKSNPEYYQTFQATNGWGTYDGFLRFVENYLENCRRFPEGKIRVSR